MQDYKEIEISELNLPPRIYIHLKKSNICTVDDLKNCDITAFNFSEREIKEIRYQLKQFGITLPEQPEPQPTIIHSEEHIRAVALHQKILTSAQLLQQNLFDMCTGIFQMKNEKLYKEFGYQTFEDYCEKELGISRRQGQKYATIGESFQNGKSTSHFERLGAEKLYLLAKLDDIQRDEITEKVDLENTTVKKLKEEIAQLKASNDDFQANIEISSKKISELQNQNAEWESKHDTLEEENNGLWKENEQLHKQVRELESRPVEVAVLEPEPSANERLLQETIKNLQIESQKRDEKLERQYREDEKAVRQMLEKQKQQALQQLTNEYEEKIKNLSAENSVSDVNVSLEVAEALISTATKIVRQIRGLALNDDENIYQYSSKLKNLIYAIEKDINDMERLSQ